eukprot:gene27609-7246_t
MDLLKGNDANIQPRIYFSHDYANDEEDVALYPTEFLNSLDTQGLPPHELKLKGRVLMPARIPNSSGSHFSNLAMLTTSAPRTANFPRAQGRGRQQVTRATASVDESEPIVDEPPEKAREILLPPCSSLHQPRPQFHIKLANSRPRFSFHSFPLCTNPFHSSTPNSHLAPLDPALTISLFAPPMSIILYHTPTQPRPLDLNCHFVPTQVMVPHPIIFKDSMSVKEAARILMEKDISGAPVVDETGKLVGVLSESDIMWKGAGAPQEHFIIHPIFIGAFDAMVYLRDNKAIEEELHKLLAKTVGEAMSKKVVSIKSDVLMSDLLPDSSRYQPAVSLLADIERKQAEVERKQMVAAAAKLMLSKKVNRLPVVDDDNKVVDDSTHMKDFDHSPSPVMTVVPSQYETGVYLVHEPGGKQTQWSVGARYNVIRPLGEGSFSCVCLAHDNLTGEKVAIKRVGDVLNSVENAKHVVREVCILRRLRHPNIVMLKDVFLKPASTGKFVVRGGVMVAKSVDVYIVMEYCSQLKAAKESALNRHWLSGHSYPNLHGAIGYQATATPIWHGGNAISHAAPFARCNWLSCHSYLQFARRAIAIEPHLPHLQHVQLAIRPQQLPQFHLQLASGAKATPICTVQLAIRPSAAQFDTVQLAIRPQTAPICERCKLAISHSYPICTVAIGLSGPQLAIRPQLAPICTVQLAIRPQLPQFARCKLAIRPQLPQFARAIGYQATATPNLHGAIGYRPQLPNLHGAMAIRPQLPQFARCNWLSRPQLPQFCTVQLAIRPQLPNLHGAIGYQATATPICTVQLAIRPQLTPLHGAIGYQPQLTPNLHGAIGYQATATTPICTVQLAIRPQLPQFARCNWLSGATAYPQFARCNWLSGPQLPQFARFQIGFRPQSYPNLPRFAIGIRPRYPNLKVQLDLGTETTICMVQWLQGPAPQFARLPIGYPATPPQFCMVHCYQATATQCARCKLDISHSCHQFARFAIGYQATATLICTVAMAIGHSYPLCRCNWGTIMGHSYPICRLQFGLSGHSTPICTVPLGYQATATPICTVIAMASGVQLPQFARASGLSGHSTPNLHGCNWLIRPQHPNLHGAIGSATATQLHGELAIRPQLPQFARCNWLSGHSYPNCTVVELAIRPQLPNCTVQWASGHRLPNLHAAIGYSGPQCPIARCKLAAGHSYPNCTVQVAKGTATNFATAAPIDGLQIGYQATATPICTVQLAIRPQLPQFARCNWLSGHSCPNLHGAIGYQATATPICTVQLAIRPQLPQFARCNWLSGHSYPNLHGAIGYQATATPICTVQLAIRPQLPHLPVCNWLFRQRRPPICTVHAIGYQGHSYTICTVQLLSGNSYPNLHGCNGYSGHRLPQFARPQLPPNLHGALVIRPKYPNFARCNGYSGHSYPICTVLQLAYQATAAHAGLQLAIRPQLPQICTVDNGYQATAAPNGTVVFLQLAL